MTNKKQLTTLVSATFAASMALSSVANAEETPFGATELSSGYNLAMAEGGCGGKKDEKSKSKKEGKCGEGKCGEGKCGGDKAKSKGKDKKEGKCGEGKCGGNV